MSIELQIKQTEENYYEFRFYNHLNFCTNSFSLKKETIETREDLLIELLHTSIKGDENINRALRFTNKQINIVTQYNEREIFEE